MTTPSRQRPRPALIEYAECVHDQLAEQDSAWLGKSTRRSFLGGLGTVGIAVLGSQLVTARAAYASTRSQSQNTLVHIALHGGVDGLRMLIPATTSLGLGDLTAVRPDLVPPASERIALSGADGWEMNSALRPLLSLWKSGELAFVPAVTSPGATRSHFESYRNLQLGSTLPSSTGWLERSLDVIGPGTTFRAMGLGEATSPMSYLGDESALVLDSLAEFVLAAPRGRQKSTITAIQGLYRGFSGDLPAAVSDIAAALGTAARLRASAAVHNGARYPSDALGRALADVATALRGEVGLQICTLDVGGWDTHSSEAARLDGLLASLAAGLAAFAQDLGPARRSRVTVLVQTEFGRRVAQNGNIGTDHGLGSVAMLLCGGLRHSGVFGSWQGLAPSTLDHGDVPGLNSPYDIMGEVVQKRLGVGSLSSVFPHHAYAPLGIIRS